MKPWATSAGVLLATGLTASYPALLALTPDDPDLRVEVPRSTPYLVQSGADAVSVPVAILPSPAPEGLVAVDSGFRPGLGLRTWSVDYSHRWEREVALPVLAGPFVSEGGDVCGYAARLGAGLFDTRGAGAGLVSLIHERLEAQFPFTQPVAGTDQSLHFAALRDVQATVRLEQGRVAVSLAIVLDDETSIGVGDATRISISFRARLRARDGIPIVERERDTTAVTWEGRTRNEALRIGANEGATRGGIFGLLGCLLGPVGCAVGVGGGALVGSDMGEAEAKQVAAAASQKEVADKLDEALARLSIGLERLTGPWHPLPRRPRDAVAIRLAGAPVVSPGGVVLPLCVRVTVAEPKASGLVPGSVNTGATRPSLHKHLLPNGAATIEVQANTDALNQILYFLWQSGTLGELGTSKTVLDEALERTRDPDGAESALQKLAFSFTGFEPGLPPSLAAPLPPARGLGFAFGDVRVGQWDDRRVVAHGLGALAVESIEDNIALSVAFTQLGANCTQRDPGGTTGGTTALTPCVSDLLPTVREQMTEKPLVWRLPGMRLIDELPSNFAWGHLALSSLRATTVPDSPGLYLSVHAAVRGKAP